MALTAPNRPDPDPAPDRTTVLMQMLDMPSYLHVTLEGLLDRIETPADERRTSR